MRSDQTTHSISEMWRFIEKVLTPYGLLPNRRGVFPNYMRRSYFELIETEKIFRKLEQTVISKKGIDA